MGVILKIQRDSSVNCTQWGGRLGSGAGTHRFLDDVEALLVDLERGHLLDDLLQQDVLLVAVALDGQLRQAEQMGHVTEKRKIRGGVKRNQRFAV